MFEEEEDGKSHDEVRQMPIYKKAWEIMELTDKVVALISDEDYKNLPEIEREMMRDHAHYLRNNAMVIPAKIAGAEGGDIYDLRMENAAIIRKAAREIMTDCTGLRTLGFKDTEYLDLLRSEVGQFRVLFAEWVKTFDQWNYIIDRWGLFNPPGVNYDDKDPDDDIPFDPSDFFDTDEPD